MAFSTSSPPAGLIVPTFTLALGQAVLPGCVVAGRLESDDGSVALACATSGGRVLVYSAAAAAAAGPGGGGAGGSAGVPAAGVRFLNINRHVTALALLHVRQGAAAAAASAAAVSSSASALVPSSPPLLLRDALLVGTASSLQAFDVYANRDVFFKELSEAATAVVAGVWPLPPPPAWLSSAAAASAAAAAGTTATLSFVGGDCALSALDLQGGEVLWGVSGGVVTALALADVDGDGRAELIVGSRDCDIRVLRGADLEPLCEAAEADEVSALCDLSCGLGDSLAASTAPVAAALSASGLLAPIVPRTRASQGQGQGRPHVRAFAYALANGTVGVYSCGAPFASLPSSSSASSSSSSFASPVALTRLWRLRAKGRAVALCAFDFDKDGQAELACAWASGRLEIRRALTGELLFRDWLPGGGGGVAGLAVADLRGDGRAALLCVACDGEVRAYPQVDAAALAAHRKAAGLTTAAAAAAAATATAVEPAAAGGAEGGKPATAAGAASTAKSASRAVAPVLGLGPEAEAEGEERALLQLLAERQRLEAMLARLTLAAASTAPVPASGGAQSPAISAAAAAPEGMLGPGVALALELSFNPQQRCLDLAVSTITPALSLSPAHAGAGAQAPLSLRFAAAFAGGDRGAGTGAGADGGGGAAFFPAGHDAALTVPPAIAGGASAGAGEHLGVRDEPRLVLRLAPRANCAAVLRVQAAASARASADHLSVLERALSLPRFALFELVPPQLYGCGSGPPALTAATAAALASAPPALTSLAAAGAAGLVATCGGGFALRPSAACLAWLGVGPAAGATPGPLTLPLPAIPGGCVAFALPADRGRPERVAAWAAQAFLIPAPAGESAASDHFLLNEAALRAPPPGSGSAAGGAPPPSLFSGLAPQGAGAGAGRSSELALDLRLISLRAGGRAMLRIALACETTASATLAGAGASVPGPRHCFHGVVQCDDMALAGEVVTDLCGFLRVDRLETQADFPLELERLAATLALVADCSAVRAKLAAEAAEGVGGAKQLVVEAEDARLRGDMRGLRAAYTRLRALQAELLREFRKRAANHMALAEALRGVNQAVQRAACLRVGEPRSRIVAACRAAIKADSLGMLLQIVSSG